MLYWQRKPEPILTTIVHEALTMCLDYADMFAHPGEFGDVFAQAGKLFALPSWRREVEKLKAANLAPEVYRPTDYHWLILYEALELFCELYNDSPSNKIVHEGTTIREVDFAGILDLFFWDLDFTISIEELSALGLQGRERMGFSDEAIGLAAGLAPHPEELALAKESEPTWDEEDPDEECPPFRRGCGTYPASGE